MSVFVVVPLAATSASASTDVSFNFDTAGQLTSEFNSYVASGSVSQTLTGGISNSGAINAPSSANAVYTTKSSYSIGPVGSSYTFTSFIQSVGNNGYSGMGFTSLAPGALSASGVPYRPNDALGISVHGGGFVFHNGVTNYNGAWQSGGSGITSVRTATISDLLNSGSVDMWYKIVLKIERATQSTFNMHVEVWPSSSAGVLYNAQASAIFELNGVTNSTLMNSPVIYSYINFSGDRVRYFDGFSVSLAGGASVVTAGNPVVLTSSTSQLNNIISASGNVTSENGSTVTDRGFVYGTTASPTVNDGKISVGNGLGAFSGTTGTLPGGTYYVRAFATNSNGTTYGSENTVILPVVASSQTVTWNPSNTTATTNSSYLIPNTSASSTGTGTISYSVVNAGTTGCSINNQLPPVISFIGEGNCVVRANAASNASFTAAFQDVTFTITAPATQTVTWAPSNNEALETAATITPNVLATSSGSGAISYSIHSAGTTGCAVNSSTGVLTFSSQGICVVRATASSNTQFSSATKDVSFIIGSTTTSLTLELDAQIGSSVANAPVEYSSSGLQPGTSWELVIRSTPQTLASGLISQSGLASGNAIIPSNLEAGWHSITLTGTKLGGGIISKTIWFKVDGLTTLLWSQATQPADLAQQTSLANTGFAVTNIFLIGLGLLILGLLVVASSYRLKYKTYPLP
ncbi:hypothetical protein [Aurantimicrobium sp. MWH-Uga1]|uniref:hypothetical protein n=1 Tax=Aurantimicrobium sp. MWH-Uga1 TaxID=2079575 RepID=UPI0013B04B76|nr:hypothetical protein [Aurantimicrobium sp. MWH-Uga1]